MTRGEYQGRLRSFYDREEIAVACFNCRNRQDCVRDAAPRLLTFGAEAHVGSRYGQVTRIVVVSLDARGDSHDLIKRQAVVEGLQGLNAHMRGTKRTLGALLQGTGAGASPWPYFAMTNAAKCSGADDKGDKVPDSLYQRCRGFARDELSLLEPEVLIAQGVQARLLLAPLVPVPEPELAEAVAVLGVAGPSPVSTWVRAVGKKYVGLTRVGADDVVTIVTPHPSDRGGRWGTFELVGLPIACWLVQQLLAVRHGRTAGDRSNHAAGAAGGLCGLEADGGSSSRAAAERER